MKKIFLRIEQKPFIVMKLGIKPINIIFLEKKRDYILT
jgi:hypothetical protein